MSNNDIKAEFTATVKEKKQANYHFKPKPLRFGHENLSKKELEELNGNTVTYKFTECTNMTTYNNYPKEIQKEFLIFLKKRYDNRIGYMAAYLGTSRPTMRTLLKSYNLYEKVKTTHLPPDETKKLKKQLTEDIGEERVSKFKNGYTYIEPSNKRKPKTKAANENTANTQSTENKTPAKEIHAKEIETVISQAMLTLKFKGEINGAELKTKLERIAAVIETGTYDIDITISQKG